MCTWTYILWNVSIEYFFWSNKYRTFYYYFLGIINAFLKIFYVTKYDLFLHVVVKILNICICFLVFITKLFKLFQDILNEWKQVMFFVQYYWIKYFIRVKSYSFVKRRKCKELEIWNVGLKWIFKDSVQYLRHVLRGFAIMQYDLFCFKSSYSWNSKIMVFRNETLF